MKLRLFAFLSLIVLALAGCQGLSSRDAATRAQQALTGSWTLKSADALPAIPDNILLMLRPAGSADGQSLGISGFSGVNHFTGTAGVNWSELRLSPGPLATTRKMGPEPRMKFEQAFLKALESVVTFRLKDDQLILSTLAGEELVFSRGTQ